MGKLTAGFGAVPKAFGLLLRHARLRRLAVVPALISTVLLLVLVVLSVRYGGALLDRLWPAPDQLEGWRAWLASGAHWLAAVLVTGLLLVLSGAVFLGGSTLVADPFIDLLSQATEQILGTVPADAPFSLAAAARDILLVLRDVAADLLMFGLAQAALLLLHLIPVAGGVLHLVAGWLVNAVFAAMEMASPPLARRGVRGLTRWRTVRAEPATFVGFGAGVVLLLLVPLAQLVTLPVAVVAGTVLVVERERAAGPEADRES